MALNKETMDGAPNDSDEDLHLSDEEGGLHVDGIHIPPPPKAYCSAESKGPRLIVTHITNSFFKSYADSQVLGPFHKCFNAIVGPNGSGKSNVIDSMLFVFGYRASKIRSKKISVLLHNSEKYSNVQSCTVTVHFAQIIDKEGDAYDVVPDSEFTVSRTAYKDNSSSYMLNGRKTHFKEIALLLRKHGVDLDHNRFLILQGEVEQISLMSPKGTESDPGMLEYLEDIIGTSRYKVPLAQLSDRVEILTEKRSEKLNRLKLVQNELNELKEPMEEAVQFLKLENSITTKKNFYYQKNIHDLEHSMIALDENKMVVDEMLQDVNQKINKVLEQKQSKVDKLKETSTKYEKLEKRKEDLKEAFDRANSKDIQLQANMTQTNNTRKKTKELLLEEQKRLETYKKAPETTKKDIQFLENNEKTLISKKEALEEEKHNLLASLREQTKESQQKKEALQMKLVDLNKIVDDTKSAFTLAESELKMYTSNYDNEKSKLDKLQQLCETSEANLIQRSDEIEKLKQLVPQNEKKISSANRELIAIKKEESEVIGNLSRKRTHLEETRSNMQASKSRGRVLDALMQQKREGKCPGLFGRLGDLGAIDAKYDVAVSTACGPLDNIVVDTVNTAQWCIEFLKKHDIGRTTIIALEKQEHLRRYCGTTIRTPENVPRLFDLIRIEDDRVRPAFYYALRDTLVADNLDQGSRIAYGAERFRVVTLNGDLIEMTGTMSGGGKQVTRGRMGQSVAVSNLSAQDIEIMENDVYNLEKRVKELRQREAVLTSEVSTLTPEVRNMKVALEKYVIELQSLRKQLPQLKEQLKVQEAKVKGSKTDPARVNQLTVEIANRKKSYDTAAGNASVLQVQVDVLTKEIMEKSQGKMQVVDKKLKEVIRSIDKGKADITKMTVGIKTAARNAQKSTEKISNMEQDITQMENKLRQLKAEREEIEADAQKLLTCIEEISAKLAEIEEFHDLKVEVEKLTKVVNNFKADKIEIEEKCNSVIAKINDLKAKIHQWRTKITHLKYQDIPDGDKEELKTYTEEELNARDLQSVQREIQVNEEEYKSAKPNLNAIVEYRNKEKVFIGRSKELDEVTEQRKKIRGYYDSLCVRRKEEFIAGYDVIKAKLKEMYQMITLGGDADFEMLDTFDPFSEGVQFRVRPPKKTWKLISNLSGGEKTLSSLALVFALHYYKPSPLYVMDEIDAALDFKNVSIVGNYIKERTKNAQFIIISLRSNMFELCDHLIGIFKTFNCTKSITIDPRIYDQEENQNLPPQNNQQNPVDQQPHEIVGEMETD